MPTAQVHRFHNDVAVYLGRGATVYLTQNEAQRIVNAMNDIITAIAMNDGRTTTTVEIPIGNSTTAPWVE